MVISISLSSRNFFCISNSYQGRLCLVWTLACPSLVEVTPLENSSWSFSLCLAPIATCHASVEATCRYRGSPQWEPWSIGKWCPPFPCTFSSWVVVGWYHFLRYQVCWAHRQLVPHSWAYYVIRPPMSLLRSNNNEWCDLNKLRM